MGKKLIYIMILILTFIVPNAFAEEENTILELDIEKAVGIGLENSISLKQIENEIELSNVSSKRAKTIKKKLEDADEKIEESDDQLADAQAILDSGSTPVAVDTEINGITIEMSAGTDISEYLEEQGISGDMNQQITQGIVSKIQGSIDSSRDMLSAGENKLDSVLEEAGVTLGESLDLATFDSLSIEATGDLMTTMANVQLEVTKASYDIYKNQIAMLIKKNYFDALKTQKIIEVKKKALQRGKKQYEFAKLSYEEGMKAKDDMLLAELFYKSKQIEYENAVGDYNNALITLKKNMGIDLDKELVLSNSFETEVTEEDIALGLVQGMKNRLEIKKSLGEVVVYDLNLKLISKKYPENTFQYREAYWTDKKAKLNLKEQKLDVESSIRESYETLKYVGRMFELSKEMVEKAKESVEIAEYKYQEGFGTETSLLKELNLESSAGTIIEVLAAEEKLTEIEEKVVEITYSYNLAKEKYYNSIGKFQY